MPRPSPNHGTLWLHNDDNDVYYRIPSCRHIISIIMQSLIILRGKPWNGMGITSTRYDICTMMMQLLFSMATQINRQPNIAKDR